MQVRCGANHWAGTGGLPAEPSNLTSPLQLGEVQYPSYLLLLISPFQEDLLISGKSRLVTTESTTSETYTS